MAAVKIKNKIALTLLLSTISPHILYAQDMINGPQPKSVAPNTENGFILGDPGTTYSSTDLSVGYGSFPSKLDFKWTITRKNSTGCDSTRPGNMGTCGFHNFNAYIIRGTDSPNPASGTAAILIGGQSYFFSTDTNFNMRADGAVLTPVMTGSSITGYVLTTSSGERITFDSIWDDTTTSRSSLYNCGGVYCKFAKLWEFPDGRFITFQYKRERSSGSGSTLRQTGRLSSVTNSEGFGYKFTYVDDSDSATTAINKSILAKVESTRIGCPTVSAVNCASGMLNYANYSYTTVPLYGPQLTTKTSSTGEQTKFTYTQGHLATITYPSNPTVAAFTNTIVWGSPITTFTQTVGGNSTIYTYNTGNNKTIVTNPDGTTKVFETAGNPGYIFPLDTVVTKFTNELGKSWIYDYDFTYLSPRLTKTTNPEGNATENIYDDRRNLVQITKHDKAQTVANDILFYSGFPSCTSANFRICNKPSYTIDGNGKRIDYLYDAAHGGVTVSLMPADASNKRAVIRYSYSAFYPTSGVSVPVGLAMPLTWLVTARDECLDSAVTGATVDFTYTCAVSNRSREAYEYVPSTSTSRTSHEFVGSVADSDGLSLRTCFKYDKVGNKIAVTTPLGTASTCI